MDHLTHSENHIPFVIPVFEPALHLYDGLGLETFPCRSGYASLSSTSNRTTASFAQGWLYFGLLREVFREGLQVEDFARPALANAPPQRLLTTAKIPDYWKHAL